MKKKMDISWHVTQLLFQPSHSAMQYSATLFAYRLPSIFNSCVVAFVDGKSVYVTYVLEMLHEETLLVYRI